MPVRTPQLEQPPSHRIHPLIGVAVLADLLAERGIDPAPMLIDEGIDPLRLHDADGRIEAAAELRLIKRAVARAGVDDLGLRAGGRHHFSLFGMWGLAIASSPDLASAIRIGLRHIGMVHTFLGWRFIDDPERPRLEAKETLALGSARAYVIERDMAGCMTLLQDLTGNRLAVTGARFPYPEPHWRDSYGTAFGPRVAFGGSHAVLGLDPDWLERPLPRANPMAARLAEEQCLQYGEKTAPPSVTAERLRRALLAVPGQLPDLATAAAACGCSPRTMRRRLAREGTSYRRELDRLRQELANRYLADTSLSVTEIAARLGYQDIAAFGHAFRRWTGTSPSRWRRARRAPGGEVSRD